MSRPPVFPVEDKIRIVLSVLAGEVTVAEAARRNKVSETSVGKWKQTFLESGKQGLAAGGSSRASSREEALAAEVEELKTALGEAHVEIRVWKKSAEGRLALRGPRGDPRRSGDADLEVLRQAGHPASFLRPLAGPGAGGPAGGEGSVAGAGR